MTQTMEADSIGGVQAPEVSFVVPCFNARSSLRASIDSIRQAAQRLSYEIVIVDDGSTDGSRSLAAELADVYVCRPVQGGAARARNDGVAQSSGPVLVFVDSDVTVDQNAVEGIVELLHAGYDAAFGAYTPLPPDDITGAASVYKNLVHHFTHMQSKGQPTTFWSGFGAVRREAFDAIGGFDATVTKSADIEDIQLGYRLSKAGYTIGLDASLQVQHHKRYTIRGMINSDVLHRAIPWTRTMLEFRILERGLNLSSGWLASAALVWGAVALTAASIASLVPLGLGLVAAAAAISGWAIVNRHFLALSARVCGFPKVISIAALHAMVSLYAPAGAILGLGWYLLRRANSSIRNTLPSQALVHEDAEIDVTVAIVVNGTDHGADIVAALPPREDWWELVVVGETRPSWMQRGDRFVPVDPGTNHGERTQAALLTARGAVFAMLGMYVIPGEGWLAAVRDVARSGDLAVCGAIAPTAQGFRRRAGATARWWQVGPGQPRRWTFNHSPGNVVFRTDVARQLGGFVDRNALAYRLTAFGARPFRFEPDLLAMPNPSATRMKLRGLFTIGRLEAACTVRYFDNGRLLQICRAGAAPIGAAWSIVSMTRQAGRDKARGLGFWLTLPLVSAGVATYHLGWMAGSLQPAQLGGRVPRGVHELALLSTPPVTPAPTSAHLTSSQS